MKTTTLRQTISLEASPKDIYDFYLDAEKHSEFTKSVARIFPKNGEPFSTYNGYITGVNLELIPGEKIIQSWKANENGWPENHFSIITILLESTNYGTIIKFTHEGVPEALADTMDRGWVEYYWAPLQSFLETAKKHI